jgi:hypothetical protein
VFKISVLCSFLFLALTTWGKPLHGEPHRPPQAPPLQAGLHTRHSAGGNENQQVPRKARPPQAPVMRKTCDCSGLCSCGCNDGAKCTCPPATLAVSELTPIGGWWQIWYDTRDGKWHPTQYGDGTNYHSRQEAQTAADRANGSTPVLPQRQYRSVPSYSPATAPPTFFSIPQYRGVRSSSGSC